LPEAVHKVGQPGQPGFGNGGQGDCIWSTMSALPTGTPITPASFYKDPFGVVHFMGTVLSADGPGGDAKCNAGTGPGDGDEDATAFVLPAGYAPQAPAFFQVAGPGIVVVNGVTPLNEGSVTIPPGAVEVASAFGTPGGSSAGQAFLDGVTFRAAGKGTGLPRAVRTNSSLLKIAGLGSK